MTKFSKYVKNKRIKSSYYNIEEFKIDLTLL